MRLSALTQADPQLRALGVALGRVTTGLLIAEGLDPRAYANSSSYCKALGLNRDYMDVMPLGGTG